MLYILVFVFGMNSPSALSTTVSGFETMEACRTVGISLSAAYVEIQGETVGTSRYVTTTNFKCVPYKIK